MELLLITGGILLILVVYYYNKLISVNNEVTNASGSINAMLKNRYDLIPNLVSTVKAYMSYERDLLEQLTTMRVKAISGKLPETTRQQLNSEISGALRQIMVAVENYPDLKTNANFLQLQESWRDIEDRIAASRRFYNHAVTDYNNAIHAFPGNVIAKIMGYKTRQVFEVTEEEGRNLDAKQLFGR